MGTTFWRSLPPKVVMRTLVSAVLLALVLASCASDGDSADVEASDTESAPVAGAVDPTPAVDDSLLDAVTVSAPATDGGDPVVVVDGELSTEETVRRVVIEGDGTIAEPGSSVTFHFTAINGRTGERFDGTRPGEAPSVTLDPESVLIGIYRSVVGLPAGTQVVAAISPADGFAPQGGFPDLGVEADDTLVFVFDIIDVSVPLERAEGTAVEPPPGLPTVALDDNGKPTIELPDADPPNELTSQLLIEGEGPVVEAGQNLTVHYTGIVWPGGEQFDSSWDREMPAAFDIGVGAVIPGWDATLVGQKVGSQLVLVIPPADGYGSEGNPSAGIEGTDSLVFVVDILGAA